jgi:DNA-binding NarL/FixJ family response regulator
VERIVERRSINDSQIQGLYKLTDRELEVLRLVCAGSINKEIAEQLYISNHTVKDHIRHIMDKLGVKSRNRIVSAIKNH